MGGAAPEDTRAYEPRRGAGRFARGATKAKPMSLLACSSNSKTPAKNKPNRRHAVSAWPRPAREIEMAVSANRLELLQIADAVAREKSIDRQIVLASMEDAIQKAARSRYGQETEVRAEINPKTGEIGFPACFSSSIKSRTTPRKSRSPRRARKPRGTGWRLDRRTLPPFDFGRIAAQSASRSLCRRSAKRSATGNIRNTRTGSAISSTAS